jgi:hypothetical protein
MIRLHTPQLAPHVLLSGLELPEVSSSNSNMKISNKFKYRFSMDKSSILAVASIKLIRQSSCPKSENINYSWPHFLKTINLGTWKKNKIW